MKITTLIKETFILNENKIISNKTLNISYGVDNNFIRPMGISMTSIIKYNPHLNIIFHTKKYYIIIIYKRGGTLSWAVK